MSVVQVKDVRDLPWAIVGTVGISTLLYVLLALSLALMVFPSIGCPDWVFFLAGASGSVQQSVSFLSAFVSGHCERGGVGWGSHHGYGIRVWPNPRASGRVGCMKRHPAQP